MSVDTRDWAEQVADLYKRLLQLDSERNEILEQLAQLRVGSAIRDSTQSQKKPSRIGQAEDDLTIPKKGIAHDVYNHIMANPGMDFTAESMTAALSLDESKKPVVTTALSRLFRARLLRRPSPGVYVLPISDDAGLPALLTPEGGPEPQID